MPTRSTARRRFIRITGSVIGLLLACLGFVFYFMHAVYEAENILSEEDIPLAVREGLNERFPGLHEVLWKLDDLYEAGFTWDGEEDTEAYFDADGAWVRSEFPVDVTELPEAAQAYLESQDNYRVVDVEKIESHAEPLTFQVEMKNVFVEWDVVFNDDGEVVSKVRDGPIIEPGVEVDEEEKTPSQP